MNKKVEDTGITITDTLQENMKHHKNVSQYLLLFILIALFGLTFFSCLYYIGSYYQNKNKILHNAEVIEINKDNINALITNDGKIKGTLDNISEETEQYSIEKVNTIVLKTDEKSKEDGKIYFNIKYNISENTFNRNMIAKNDSDLLVRFSYSFDNDNWTYLNNVITTNNNSTINPMMGNFYDIAGYISDLNVQTGYELTSKPGEEIKMYWKCETIMSNIKDNADKKIIANFNIEYKK